jgi:hypothetical protein
MFPTLLTDFAPDPERLAPLPCVLIYGETDHFLQFVCNGREEEPLP